MRVPSRKTMTVKWTQRNYKIAFSTHEFHLRVDLLIFLDNPLGSSVHLLDENTTGKILCFDTLNFTKHIQNPTTDLNIESMFLV